MIQIKDEEINKDILENTVKKIADFGMNAAIAETTYQLANRVAKEITGTWNSTYNGGIKNGKLYYTNLEKILEKYFNKQEYHGETYWFDKTRKSITSWLHSDNKGTMENPNI